MTGRLAKAQISPSQGSRQSSYYKINRFQYLQNDEYAFQQHRSISSFFSFLLAYHQILCNFGDKSTIMSQQSIITIPKPISGEKLSKQQRRFNANIERIEVLKKDLDLAKKQVANMVQRIQKEILPLENKYTQKLVMMVKLFDWHYHVSDLKAKDRDKLAHFIVTKSYELIHFSHHTELQEIYQKYQTNHQEKSVIQKNKDVDDVFEEDSTAEPIPEKPKTERQLAREEKLKEELSNMSKTARSIYAELVKSFHPDLEQDEAEKERKTKIMHQITEAYKKEDVFELLRLKVSLQEQQITAANMADDRLLYFNKLLEDQIEELTHEIQATKGEGSNQGELWKRFGAENPKTMDIIFKGEIKQLKRMIKSLTADIEMLRMKEYLLQFLHAYSV